MLHPNTHIDELTASNVCIALDRFRDKFIDKLPPQKLHIGRKYILSRIERAGKKMAGFFK